MTLEPVDSSMVHAVGYDEDEHELEVVFKNGGIYRYENVDEEEYEGLMAADSKGRYVRAHLIDRDPYDKVS